ncbi:MAG: hypothetical protein II569_01040, partial [Paludibacteraceae bacterium]|nr:hypothetical protein [Paludibacteraceae bacterium]
MATPSKYNLITITGPTACGKTAFAVRLAKEMDGEIISADSRQVYRGMDIGTGKDLDEYRCEDGTQIRHHLIDGQLPPGLVRIDIPECVQDLHIRSVHAKQIRCRLIIQFLSGKR